MIIPAWNWTPNSLTISFIQDTKDHQDRHKDIDHVHVDGERGIYVIFRRYGRLMFTCRGREGEKDGGGGRERREGEIEWEEGERDKGEGRGERWGEREGRGRKMEGEKWWGGKGEIYGREGRGDARIREREDWGCSFKAQIILLFSEYFTYLK